jgi:hypothetical protein
MAGRKFLPGDVTIFAKGNVHNQQEMETFYNGWAAHEAGVGAGVGLTWLRRNSDNRMSEENLSKKPEKNEGKLDWDIDKMFAKFTPMK